MQKAKDFYIGFLGFNIDWEHRFDDTAPFYMQISRDGCTLHLSEHHGDGTPGTYVFLRVTGLDDYHKEITSKSYKYMRPGINTTFHDSRQVVVYDPFGNRLIFDEAIA